MEGGGWPKHVSKVRVHINRCTFMYLRAMFAALYILYICTIHAAARSLIHIYDVNIFWFYVCVLRDMWWWGVFFGVANYIFNSRAVLKLGGIFSMCVYVTRIIHIYPSYSLYTHIYSYINLYIFGMG